MKKTTGPKIKFKKVEKVLLFLIILVGFMCPVVIVYTNAYLSSSNIEIEKLKEAIEKQNNINSSLSMQVDELASLSTIQDVAKNYGLVYNNDKIIVIK